jgi:hypothetical protein
MNDFFVPVATSTHQQTPIATSTGIAEEDEELQVNKAYLVTWEDTFFDNEENLIAVFDFDYPLMEAYHVKLRWVSTIAGHLWWLFWFILMVSPFLPFVLEADSPAQVLFYVLFPFAAITIVSVILNGCFLKKRAQWDVYSHHLCITRDGINYVRDKRKTCFGWPCSDAGKTTQIVPLDKITNVDIMEPAGNTCCCVRNTLTTVKLSSTSSELGGYSLVLCGLKEPYKFKNYIMETKRANSNSFMACAASAQIVPNRDVFPVASNKEII